MESHPNLETRQGDQVDRPVSGEDLILAMRPALPGADRFHCLDCRQADRRRDALRGLGFESDRPAPG